MLLDVTFGRRELQAVRSAARKRDWPGLLDALTREVADAEDRSDRVDVAAKTIIGLLRTRIPGDFAEWSQQYGTDPSVAALRGACQALTAWHVRGGQPAAQTARHRLIGFREGLDEAELWLRNAASLNPDDATPWVWLLYIARGQEVGLEETLLRREELARRAPTHFVGHFRAIGSMSPAWGYHYSHMYQQLGNWTADMPAGSLMHALVFVAHAERWRRRSGQSLRWDPEMRRLAYRASALMNMETSDRPGNVWAHNYAAGWYSITKERDRAKTHFDILRGHRTPWPWADMTVGFGYSRLAAQRLPRRKRPVPATPDPAAAVTSLGSPPGSIAQPEPALPADGPSSLARRATRNPLVRLAASAVVTVLLGYIAYALGQAWQPSDGQLAAKAILGLIIGTAIGALVTVYQLLTILRNRDSATPFQ